MLSWVTLGGFFLILQHSRRNRNPQNENAPTFANRLAFIVFPVIVLLYSIATPWQPKQKSSSANRLSVDGWSPALITAARQPWHLSDFRSADPSPMTLSGRHSKQSMLATTGQQNPSKTWNRCQFSPRCSIISTLPPQVGTCQPWPNWFNPWTKPEHGVA